MGCLGEDGTVACIYRGHASGGGGGERRTHRHSVVGGCVCRRLGRVNGGLLIINGVLCLSGRRGELNKAN